MGSDTRERLVESSAELFRRQGYTGTGIKQILAAANAPFGSLYHFFPGGKEQLGAETIRSSGALYMQLFAIIAAQAPDVLSAVGEFFAGAAETLRETDYEDACPIATVALEVASTNEPLREATAEVFESWIAAASEYFAAAGVPRGQARALALSMLSLLEGAFVFCRAMRSTEPLEAAGACAVAAVRAALGGDPARIARDV
ncbi:MAG TPA: TetR/AcrR family transcriptional regulator [Solirubrobacteraceae bacterium]|jgi:AcrR family transcriptional regulator|nr:TetR/AcrR family transcriptional regulator [Solirubrobacteraceae bacterium]